MQHRRATIGPHGFQRRLGAAQRERRALMWVLRVIGAHIALPFLTLAPAHADDVSALGRGRELCREVRRSLDAMVIEASDPRALLRLAPFMSDFAARRLLDRAPDLDENTAFHAYVAIGLSRHAESLRSLRETPEPGSPLLRLGRALAFLALGDGARTSTITFRLFDGTMEDRRRIVDALSRMKQKRPELMLAEALEDPDEAVRYAASRVLVRAGASRGRRAMLDLFRNGSDRVRARAARALAAGGYAFRAEEIALLSPPMRIDALVEDASRAHRTKTRLLTQEARSTDEVVRAAALAAFSLTGQESVSTLRKIEKSELSPSVSPALLQGDIVMARALVKDPEALGSLERLDASGAVRASLVLWAFSRAGPPKNQLEPDHAGQIARAIEGWLARGVLGEHEVSRVLRAMERCDPLGGLRLARARMVGPDGGALRTAVRVIGRGGSIADLPELIRLGGRASPETRIEVWRAGVHVCRR